MNQIAYENLLRKYDDDMGMARMKFIATGACPRRPMAPAVNPKQVVRCYEERGRVNIWFDGRVNFDDADRVLVAAIVNEVKADHSGVALNRAILDLMNEHVHKALMDIDRIRNQVRKIDFRREAETGSLLKMA